MNVLSLFSGIAGLDLGIKIAVPEARVICHVEFDAYCRRVLLARMSDGSLDPCPIHGDVRTFDGRPWRGVVDCIAGGFPCQDISNAGRRAGIGGERSGLWSEFARLVGEIRPRYVFVENVSALLVRGVDRVLGDLAALGYDAEWLCLSAAAVGAPHLRKRVFILAHAGRERDERRREAGDVAGTGGSPQGEARQRQRGRDAAGGGLGPLADSQEQRGELRAAEGERPGRPAGGNGAVSDASILLGSAEQRVEPNGAGAGVADAESVDGERTISSGGRFGKPEATDRDGGSTLGNTDAAGLEGRCLCGECSGDERTTRQTGLPSFPPAPGDREGWQRYLEAFPDLEPSVRRGSDGLSGRVDRLRALGNAVVAVQAAAAFTILSRRLNP